MYFMHTKNLYQVPETSQIFVSLDKLELARRPIFRSNTMTYNFINAVSPNRFFTELDLWADVRVSVCLGHRETPTSGQRTYSLYWPAMAQFKKMCITFSQKN